ncbi:MAG: hypothetical protein AMXMBFR13_03760 [Phycisphaerae bacterium]
MRAIVEDFSSYHQLSRRETEVLRMICEGAKNSLIAQELGISPTTVRLHITNIHRKLDTFNKVDVVLKMWHWWMKRNPRHTASSKQDHAIKM